LLKYDGVTEKVTKNRNVSTEKCAKMHLKMEAKPSSVT